jgi:hypothetical protein
MTERERSTDPPAVAVPEESARETCPYVTDVQNDKPSNSSV